MTETSLGGCHNHGLRTTQAAGVLVLPGNRYFRANSIFGATAEATHCTSAVMAKVVDIRASSVQRIWRAHGPGYRAGGKFRGLSVTIFYSES
jgi:hypothetical protein